MKNGIFMALMAFFALVLLVGIAYADVKPNVIVSGFAIKGEAYVGKKFMLEANLTNTEPASCAKSITSSVEAGFPFIMDGISTFPAGDLCYGSSAIVDFPMKIDPTASGGFYQIKVNNNYESVGYIQFTTTSTLNVFVSGSPEINANIINSEPIDIYPGDTGTLTVKIENDGGFQAQSLSAVMKADSPIEVKWAKSSNSIEVLEPRQGKNVEFAVEVPKNAEAKAYPLELEVAYNDENNAKQYKTISLSFYVRKKADFETMDSSSDSLYANQNSRHVRFMLENTGTDAARKIRAKILPQFPFSTDGSVRYIEMLGTGKSEPVDFNVNIDKDATPGKYSLDMLVDFEDAQEKKFQDTTQIVLEVKPKGFIRLVFIDYWLLWLIAIGAGSLIYRRRHMKAKK